MSIYPLLCNSVMQCDRLFMQYIILSIIYFQSSVDTVILHFVNKILLIDLNYSN